jgi:hypothetical protein
MRKDIGNNKKQALDAAVSALGQFKRQKIKNLNANEVKELLTIVMQLLGLADKDGIIK